MSKIEQIIEEIRKIYDPELPVNIYELGLIYDIKVKDEKFAIIKMTLTCLLYTSPSPRDSRKSRMPSSA